MIGVSEVITCLAQCPEGYHIVECRGVISSAAVISREEVCMLDGVHVSDTDDRAAGGIRKTSAAAGELLDELCRQAGEAGCNALCNVRYTYSACPDGSLVAGISADKVKIERDLKTDSLISDAISAAHAAGAMRGGAVTEDGEYTIRINSVEPGNEDELTAILAGLSSDPDDDEIYEAHLNLPFMMKKKLNAVISFDAVNRMKEQGINADVLDDTGRIVYGADNQ